MDVWENVENNKSTTECSGCSCCAMRAEIHENGLSGLKLVICAFLVFVLPLLNMAIAAGISYQQYQCPIWMTVLISLAAAGITIIGVRIVTRHIHTDPPPGSDSCRKDR